MDELGVSERHARRVIGQNRLPERKSRVPREDEDFLTAANITLAERLSNMGLKTLYIEPSILSENGYCESFKSKLRYELLAREIFYDLREVKVLIESWHLHYNTVRSHSSLEYRPPAPETILPTALKRKMSLRYLTA